MRKTRNIRGIIYRIFNSGDSDRIIHLINTNGSKEAILVKNGRKQTSRKSQSLEIGNLASLKVVDGYAVPILSDIKLINENLYWKNDLEKITSIQFIFEVLNYFCIEESEDRALFKTINDFLELKSEDLIFLLSITLLQIMEISGNTPLTAQSSENDSDEIPERIQKTQAFIIRSDIKTALRVNLTELEKKKMLKLHVRWIEEIIERNLKSKPILYSILKI